MKKLSRMLSVLLCILLCCACVPACAQEAQEKSPLYIEGSEGVTLTYWIPMSATQTQYFSNLNEHPFWQWMEEQTGVHIEFVHPSEEQMETQATLMMASGKYYDLMFQFEYPDGPQAGVEDGVFADLNQYADLMPNYQAALRSENGDYYADWEWGPEKDLYVINYTPPYLKNALAADGSLWCATQIDLEAGGMVGRGCLIRKDWLDEAGLDIPETVDEWETVLEAFKNRGDDVIPMMLTETAMQGGCGALCNMFDIYPSWYTVDENGQVMVAGFADDHAKDYFTLMNKWYEAGYIDPDFMNRGDVATGWDSLILSDRLGIIIDVHAGTAEGYENRYTGDQNFDLEPIPMPRLNKEQTLHFNNVAVDSRVTCYTVLSEACEHKEIAAQWLDVLYSKEAFMRASYGVEGESYVLEDGIPYYTDWYYNNDTYDVNTLRNVYLMYGGSQWGVNYSGLLSHRAMSYLGLAEMDVEKQKTSVPSTLETQIVWSKNSDNALAIGWVSFEGDEWGRMYDPYTEAATYANAMALKFITGVEPLENFEEYQRKALELGFAESRDRMQETYDKVHAND